MTKQFILTIELEDGGVHLSGGMVGVKADSPADMSMEEKFAATCLMKAKDAVMEYVTETKEFNAAYREATPEQQAAMLKEKMDAGYTVANSDGDIEEAGDDRPSILH